MSQNRTRAAVVAGALLFVVVMSNSPVEAFGIGPLGEGNLKGTVSDFAENVNGEAYLNTILDSSDGFDIDDEASESLVSESDNMVSDFAKELTYSKFLTMQRKRVPVVIRYTADAGLKPYFLTVAQKIKQAHPDVILDKTILPAMEDGDSETTFEVVVDGKVVVGQARKEREPSKAGLNVFVSMQEVELGIVRARRRRRPATVYGEEASDIRLEMLRSKTQADQKADRK